MKKYLIAILVYICIISLFTSISFAASYIEVNELEEWKSSLQGEGSLTFNKDNKTDLVLVKKSNYDDKNNVTFTIREKDKLTENSYNSILSVLDIIFDSNNVSKYFSSTYNGFELGNKEFDGFKIEINPEFNSNESFVFDSELYKLTEYGAVRVTVNKEVARNKAEEGLNVSSNSTLNNSTNIVTTSNDNKANTSTNSNNNKINTSANSNNNNKNTEKATLPKTGKNTMFSVVFFIIVIIAIMFYIKNKQYKDIQ